MIPGLPTRPCLPCPPGMSGGPHSMQGLGAPQTSPRSNNPYSDEPMSPNGKKLDNKFNRLPLKQKRYFF